MDCEYCLVQASTVILLSNGEEFYVCSSHIVECIKDNASKENPVHSIDYLEHDEPSKDTGRYQSGYRVFRDGTIREDFGSDR